VNCYQPPIIWDRASGYQVFDADGNCWIDFSSTAVMTNTGHGHPAIRAAIAEHARTGLLAQFSFASEIRIRLAEELLKLAPRHCEKVYFWTVGSEATECALRLARVRGMQKNVNKHHILSFTGDYHGWTLGAHQLSGDSAAKPWLTTADSAVHHLPFPRLAPNETERADREWSDYFDACIKRLTEAGVAADEVAGVFVETLQGWCATPLPVPYLKRLREWADKHDVLLIFDEIQTDFGRTGMWFAHEHYGIRADLICVAKGISSTLPLAAVLGPAEVLDLLSPGEVTTTHAAHPLSCAAALANLKVLRDENLIAEAARKGEIAGQALAQLQTRFPRHISQVTGWGLLRAIHLQDPVTGQPSRELARDWTWAAVKHGVMLFQVNQPTVKVCPPLVIPDDAIVEGVVALGDALQSVVDT
jgi:4-aminobutyrate aminotransferase-like enzyme